MKNAKVFLFFASVMLLMSSCMRHVKTDHPAEGRPAGDNSRVSLDWEGTYRGILPCADCQGIETTVTLDKNGTCLIRSRYLAKSDRIFSEACTFVWDREGRTIAVSAKESASRRYLVGENMLVQLDMQGKRITGLLADKYVLGKVVSPEAMVPDASLSETYWKLVELNGKPLKQLPFRQQAAHIILKKADGRVQGSGGCNRFFGRYEIRPGNRIHFSGLGSTMMACPGLADESAFFKVLETADTYTIRGESLQLHKARMAPLAKFEAVYLK